MQTNNTTAVSSANETLVLVNPKTLVKNKFKADLYKEDITYDWFLHNVKTFGIREPIIADIKSKMVISGNRRLMAALSLGLTDVPVIFRELEKDKSSQNAIFVSHEVQREKTYSQYLAEYKILRETFPMTQGTRTDIGDGVPTKELQAVLSQISRSTMFYLVKIDEMVKANYPGGKDSETYKRIWKELDSGISTPSKWYNKLINLEKKKSTSKKLQDTSFASFDCRFLNKSCEDLSDLSAGSVACFLSSPPYWGFKKEYGGIDENVLGTEEKFESYITNLVKIYKNALPKLKKGGSIWVNLSEAFNNQTYNLVPHRFAIKMMEELDLVVNDEIVWSKPPQFNNGKRGARGFEFVFQFVRREDCKNIYHNSSWLELANDAHNKISLSGGELTKKQSSHWDFRDGVLETKIANITKLRNVCKKLGINCDHDATYPVEVAMIPILSSTGKGDLVVDLFGGVGTTALVAGTLKRKSVSYEINPEYCKAAHVLLGELITKWESEELLPDQPLTELVSEMDMSFAA
jgi:site-specific DNA-methyltransferase (adenine-specific)